LAGASGAVAGDVLQPVLEVFWNANAQVFPHFFPLSRYSLFHGMCSIASSMYSIGTLPHKLYFHYCYSQSGLAICE
jgi:hypothetical protein